MENNLRAPWRLQVLRKHLPQPVIGALQPSACLAYEPPEAASEVEAGFDTVAMRRLLDGHDLEARDWAYELMATSDLFASQSRAGFASPDFDEAMDVQRERTMERIRFLARHGAFRDFFSADAEKAMRRTALFESFGVFDHALTIKLGVHFHLWFGVFLEENGLGF